MMFRRTLTLGLALVAGVALAVAASADLTSKGPKPRRIAAGQEVKITDYLVPGKITVFDFTSEFCPPCRAIAPALEKMHGKRADIAVVAVDINRPDVKGIDWKSPVARQYNLNSIPHFKVFGPDGKLMAEDGPEDAKARSMIVKWLD